MSTDVMELTDRELAIARGENPDSFTEGAAENEIPAADTKVNAEPEAPQAGIEADNAGKDAATAGGKDAPVENDWINDEVRQLGSSYGMSDDDIKSFSNAEELRRAGSLLDRHFAKAAKPSSHAEQVANAEAAKNPDEQLIDVEKLKTEGYDDTTIEIAKRHNASVESHRALENEVGEIRKTSQAAQQRAFDQTIHTAIDSIDDKLFGRVTDKDGKQVQLEGAKVENRKRLLDAAETIATGIVNRAKSAGQQPQLPPLPVLLQRAKNMAFADEIRSADREAMKNAASKQGKQRRPVGTTRHTNPGLASTGDAKPDEVREVADNPEVKRLWDQMQADNGK